MGLLTVDKRKCNKDGICIAECPTMSIRFNDGDGFPETAIGGEEACTRCGHCLAVCPTNALSHEDFENDNCPKIMSDLLVDEDQVLQFLRSRRSIRVYKNTPVEESKIRKTIDIARYAPTGGNKQIVEWVVYNGKEKVQELAGLTAQWLRHALENDPKEAHFPVTFIARFLAAWDAGDDRILRGAPALVVAMAPKEVGNGVVDPSIALTYFQLAALTQGLGTCWAGFLRRAMTSSHELREEMGITDEYPYYYPMMLGYPKFRYLRLPERREPKILWR